MLVYVKYLQIILRQIISIVTSQVKKLNLKEVALDQTASFSCILKFNQVILPLNNNLM